MVVYDTVNKLAQELKETEAYLEFKKMREMINANEELKNKLKEFDKMRYESQVLAMQGGKPEESSYQKLQEVYGELIQDENAKMYLEAEMKFNTLMSDVNRIIGEAVVDILK